MDRNRLKGTEGDRINAILILVGLGLTIWVVSTLVCGAALALLRSMPPSPGNRSESDI